MAEHIRYLLTRGRLPGSWRRTENSDKAALARHDHFIKLMDNGNFSEFKELLDMILQHPKAHIAVYYMRGLLSDTTERSLRLTSAEALQLGFEYED